MNNQENIRLVDCFYEPSSVFSLYDYTKIIYPIDGYICMRQISISDSQPAFIQLNHSYDKVHYLLTYPNLIVSLEQNSSKEYSVGFYDSMHFHTKLSSSLAQEFKKAFNPSLNQSVQQKILEFKLKISESFIFILFSLKSQYMTQLIKDFIKPGNKQSVNQEANDNELIVVNTKTKRIISKNYFSGNVKAMFVKSNDNFSLLFEDSSLFEYKLYENYSTKESHQNFSTMKNKQMIFIHPTAKVKNEITHHLWLKQELIIINKTINQIEVFFQDKKVQSISLEHVKNVMLLWPLMFGFLVCNENFMHVYKKIEMSYICIAEFFIREVGFSPELILSPQEDIIAYFMHSNKSIQCIKGFRDQVQSQAQSQKIQTKQLKSSRSIRFKKNQDLKINVNKKNNTFVIFHESTVQFYSINNFELYLQESIESQEIKSNSPIGKMKRQKTLGQGSTNEILQKMNKNQTVLKVGIHPYCQLVAIAIKSKIRIYQILFNELHHVKDILISNCSQMFYSNSGQFLSVVVSGRYGSKCYIYKANEDYELVQCLSIGKKIVKFVWSKYDQNLYGVYNHGYYRWSIENGLKNRFESLFDIPFIITDALLNDRKDIVLLYGEHEILEINHKMDKENQFNPKDILTVQNNIKQIVYENGKYFLSIRNSPALSIVSCEELSTLDSAFKQYLSSTPSQSALSKTLAIYKETSGQTHNYQMIPCSGDTKRNIIFILNEETRNLKVLQWGKSSNKAAKLTRNSELVKIDRKNLRKLFKKYSEYENQIKVLEKNFHQTLERMKTDLDQKQKVRQKSFLKQIKSNESKYEQIKIQKQKLEHTIEQKIQKHQKQTIKQLKQLENIYQRKIAITTNKLLTSEEINYRNMLLAEENLKKLEMQAGNDVEKIRKQYKQNLADYMSEKDFLAEEVYKIKKQYESRLYDLEQENERILEQYQAKAEDNIQALRKRLFNEQVKYSEVISKKDNLQKSLHEQLINSEILKQKITYLEGKIREANKKTQYLLLDIQKYQKILDEKNTQLAIYEERVSDLQKSNEILKYRVVEFKREIEPQSEENQKLKINLNQLENEYDKIVKSTFEKQQFLNAVKKESIKSKQTVQKLKSKSKKIQKSYLDLLDKVLSITKSPIQEIRQQLINLLNSTKQDQKYANRPVSSYGRSQSPLGELNRIREHLEACLHQAVDSNKKSDQQKNIELMKKNRQNSELIKEINDLRKKVKDFEEVVKEKDIQINRILRGDPLIVNSIHKSSLKQNTKLHFHSSTGDENQNQEFPQNLQQRIASRTNTRKQTRETKESFFDKSLFKSASHWRQKRLKTEHMHYREKKSRSVKRNTSGKFLQIDSQTSEDVQNLKRMIEQKQTIIKQLINKIQSLS